MKLAFSLLALAGEVSAAKKSEYVVLPDHTVYEDYEKLPPSSYLDSRDLPDAFT